MNALKTLDPSKGNAHIVLSLTQYVYCTCGLFFQAYLFARTVQQLLLQTNMMPDSITINCILIIQYLLIIFNVPCRMKL